MNHSIEYVVYRLAKETTRILNTNQSKLRSIKWTDGESNLDSGFSQLACMTCEEAWEKIKDKFPEHSNLEITCSIPDINIIFVNSSCDGKFKKIKSKIELKSSKMTKMPGSTIKKLDINQPMIYCLRPVDSEGMYHIRCTQYHRAMGESKYDLFQDRTPRPFINFEKMSDDEESHPFVMKDKGEWVRHFAQCAVDRIQNQGDCQKSWQDDLIMYVCNIVRESIIQTFIKNTSVEEFASMKR